MSIIFRCCQRPTAATAKTEDHQLERRNNQAARGCSTNRIVNFALGVLLAASLAYPIPSFSNSVTLPTEKTATDIEFFKSPSVVPLPFSRAVRVGNTLYLSGVLGADYSTGKIVPGGIKAETKQIMENIKATLETCGSSLDHVVRCLVMIENMDEWSQFNEVYATYFDKDRLPARSAFGAKALAWDAKVEVECTAIIKDKNDSVAESK